jgi:hypothetical protein
LCWNWPCARSGYETAVNRRYACCTSEKTKVRKKPDVVERCRIGDTRGGALAGGKRSKHATYRSFQDPILVDECRWNCDKGNKEAVVLVTMSVDRWPGRKGRIETPYSDIGKT